MEQPSNLGRYQLLRILGRGAMGVVYEGIDPKLNRQVAVKTILKSQLVDPGLAAEYTARFMREAQAVARLNHPNIVQVFDFGNEADVTYLVMEFIRGKELKGYLEEKRLLGIDQVVHIVGDLLQALDYAHEHGVIHRDIKPANVMLDGAGRVKLTDFGVARLSDAGGSEGTRPGTMVGTPGYMAPEQIKGLSVGPQADIFATGVLLYQCLTLQKPFTGSSDWDVYHKIVNEDPPPLSQFRGGIPPALEAVVRRALAKEPKDRYPSAGAMAADLRQSVSGRTFDDEATRLVYDARPMPTAPDRTHITGTTNTVVSTPRAGTSDTERDFWNSIKDSGDIEELREFLNQFPDSVFANLAKIRINKLTGQGTTGVDSTQLKAAAEAEAERKAQEEAQRKSREDARLKAEEEARRQAEQERQRRAQKEAQRQVEEETRRRAEQEAQKKAAATAGGKSEQERQKERAEALRQEEDRQKAEAERQKAEEARKAEQEARRRADEAERQHAAREAEDARLRADAEARRRAEEEARRRSEEEARRRGEEETRRRAEQEARAQETARQRAEEDARRRAQEQARMTDDGGDDSDRTVVLGRASPLAAAHAKTATAKTAPAAPRPVELPVAADLPDSVLAPITAEPLAPTRPTAAAAAGDHPQYSTLDLPGKKSKMPLIAGGAAVALIAVGALMFMGPSKDQASHAPQPTAQTPAAATPSAPAPVPEPVPAPVPAAAPATAAADDAALKQKQAQEAAARKAEEQAAETSRQKAEADAAARQKAEAEARKQAQTEQRKAEAEAKAKADEAKKAAEAQKKEEARKAEEARKKEEARKSEEARKKEEARAAFEASPEGILARARAARKANNASDAIKLYAEAYNKGSGQAAKELGDYYQAAGPNQDPDAAALWYNRAKQKGIKTGK